MPPTKVSGELTRAWSQLLDETTDVCWLTARYENKASIVLKETGVGGRTACLASVEASEEVIFGGFRVTGVEEGGATTQHIGLEGEGEASGYRVKIVQFQYNPAASSAMAKARASSDRGLVHDTLTSAHCFFQVDELADLSEEEIIRKLAATGASSSHYDFENKISRSKIITHVAPRVEVAVENVKAPPEPVLQAADETPVVEAGDEPPGDPEPSEPAVADAPILDDPKEPAPLPIPAPPPIVEDVVEETKPVPKVKKASPGSHAILLFTSVPASVVVEGHQTFIRQTFAGRKIPFVELDGMDMSKKDERNALFSISSLRGKCDMSTRRLYNRACLRLQVPPSLRQDRRSDQLRRRRRSYQRVERLRVPPSRHSPGQSADRNHQQRLCSLPRRLACLPPRAPLLAKPAGSQQRLFH